MLVSCIRFTYQQRARIYMSNTTITEEAIKQRRAYYKKWRATHKEQIKTYNTRYWEKKAKESKDND